MTIRRSSTQIRPSTAIFSAILLTKAVLFVGYSLNDPDFRLLLDRQLTVFRGNIPERYALMAGIGKVERDVLWRTARIRVLPYDDGKHEQVLEFLRTLLDQVSAEPAVAAAIPPAVPAATPAQAQVDAAAAPHLFASAIPSTTLSIRLRRQTLEASVSLRGNAVQGSGAPPNWSQLPKLIEAALGSQFQARTFGEELGKLLPEIVLSALKDVPADHTITLRLSPEVELLPWEMAEVDGRFLVLRNPLVRAPIGLPDTARGYPIVRQPTRVLLIGDPNQDDGLPLPGALAEVTEIAKVYGEHPTLVCDSLDRSVCKFRQRRGRIIVRELRHRAFRRARLV